MRYGRYGWTHLLLSWGLGITFLWIGVDMFLHPETWLGYIPQNVPGGFSRAGALRIAGGLDIALGLLFIVRRWQKLTALVASIHLLGILVTQGIDAVLIRDVGLLGAALALLKWPTKYKKRSGKWWQFWKGSKSDDDE